MRRRKALLPILLAVALVVAGFPASPSQAETKVLETGVSTASANCSMVGLYGNFYSDAQAALDRINEIRKEACTDGDVPNPNNTSTYLTEADYVPVKWSAILETVARIRASEAALIQGHTRANGTKSVFSVISGDQSNYEDLAWNSRWSKSMITGIDQWYSEKAQYKQDKAFNVSTGHYVSMIDPSCRYVGLGLFLSENAKWNMTLAGRFSKSMSGTDETMQSLEENIIQKIDLSNSLLGTLSIREKGASTSRTELQVGNQAAFEAMYQVSGSVNGSSASGKVAVLDGVTWSSNDTGVARVAQDGKVTALKGGNVTITATAVDGKSAQLSLTVKGTSTPTPTATAKSTPTATAKSTPTATAKATPTATAKATPTATAKATPTATAKVTPTATAKVTPTATAKATPTATAKSTPTATAKATPTATAKSTPTATAKSTPTATARPVKSAFPDNPIATEEPVRTLSPISPIITEEPDWTYSPIPPVTTEEPVNTFSPMPVVATKAPVRTFLPVFPTPTGQPFTQPTKTPGVAPTVAPRKVTTPTAMPTATPKANSTLHADGSRTTISLSKNAYGSVVEIVVTQTKVDGATDKQFFEVSDGGLTLKEADTSISSVTIADVVEVNGTTYKITVIAANAYRGNRKIRSLTVGENVSTIGTNAFKNCRNLQNITISDSIRKIGKGAFSGIKKGAVIKVDAKNRKSFKKVKKLILKSKTKKVKIKMV